MELPFSMPALWFHGDELSANGFGTAVREPPNSWMAFLDPFRLCLWSAGLQICGSEKSLNALTKPLKP